jgi:hypothetical protein
MPAFPGSPKHLRTSACASGCRAARYSTTTATRRTCGTCCCTLSLSRRSDAWVLLRSGGAKSSAGSTHPTLSSTACSTRPTTASRLTRWCRCSPCSTATCACRYARSQPKPGDSRYTVAGLDGRRPHVEIPRAAIGSRRREPTDRRAAIACRAKAGEKKGQRRPVASRRA